MTKEKIIEQLRLIEAVEDSSSCSEIRTGTISVYPELLQKIAEELQTLVKDLHFDFLCPVEPSSIPLVTCLSLIEKKPLIPFPVPSVRNFIKPGQTALLLDLSPQGSPKCLNEAFRFFIDQHISVTDAVLFMESFFSSPSLKTHGLWTTEDLAFDITNSV